MAENAAHSRKTGMGYQDDERSWDDHRGLRMSNNGQPKKFTSFVQDVRQKLIDELIAVSDKWKVGDDGSNFDKLQQERLAVLNLPPALSTAPGVADLAAGGRDLARK